jgi:hypothetical protein
VKSGSVEGEGEAARHELFVNSGHKLFGTKPNPSSSPPPPPPQYYVDADGKIVKHIISNVEINDKPMAIGLGVGELFKIQQGKLAGEGSMGGYGFSGGRVMADKGKKIQRDVLLQLHAKKEDHEEEAYWKNELISRNEARRKFGLDPITREELDKIAEGNQEMLSRFNPNNAKTTGAPTRGGDADLTVAQSGGPLSLLSNMIDAFMKDVDAPKKCTTWEDCDGQECCDLIVAKICCNNGQMSSAWMPEMVPVRIDEGEGEGWKSPQNGPLGR